MISVFQKFLHLFKANLLLSFIGIFILGGSLSFIISEKRSDDKCILDLNSNNVVTSDPNTKIFVDLSGAVNKPGLYEMEKDKRVGDLVVLGSGVSENASDLWVSKSLNLSKKLSDASKVYVPFEWENYTPADNSEDSEDSDNSGTNNDSEDNEGTSEDSSGKLNVNTASSSDLDKLPGIGPAYAEKIINNRPYNNLSEFESKSGLYKSTIEGLKDLISF